MAGGNPLAIASAAESHAGLYPERREDQETPHPVERLLPRRTHRLKKLQGYADQVLALLADQESVDTDYLQTETRRLQQQLRNQGLTDTLAVRAFALVCLAAQLQLGLTPRRVQIIGAWIMLRGQLAEMQTGEGKTLTATLPASAVALAGIPVHIITANDYLAARDAEIMAPVYAALGLRVAAITSDMKDEQRRDAYAADITYCSSQQLVFDYLRDRVTVGNNQGALRLALEELYETQPRKERLLLRGLFYAIVDEADSVLIDEARTPLLLSRTTPGKINKSTLVTALFLARKLEQDRHYRLDYRQRRVELTSAGEGELATRATTLDGFWQGDRRRRYLITQALSALYLFTRDRDYLLRNDQVEIIDGNTGRSMPDRAWEKELHALIELKEGLKPSGQRENIARLTYQRFFRRYITLAGMSGTIREVDRELKRVYRLSVIDVPTHKPPQRSNLGFRCLPSRAAHDKAIVSRVQSLVDNKRAVLIGTRSLAESEHLALQLDKAGIAYQLLNARQDKHEAEIIAQAGQPSTVTIATNMAGRGTDIDLHHSVIEAGGLHVIATEINDAQRIDRQLFGRAARQGQPGSFEMILHVDDEMLLRHLPARLCQALAGFAPGVLLRMVQRKAKAGPCVRTPGVAISSTRFLALGQKSGFNIGASLFNWTPPVRWRKLGDKDINRKIECL